MKQALIIAVVLLVVAAGVFAWQRTKSRANTPRTFQTTNDYIQFMAGEAVKDAEKEEWITLDYSIDSIKKVDVVLGHIHDQYVKNKLSSDVDALASAYGAYIGEVIRRSEPGAKWDRDHPVAGPKSYPLHWGSGDSFPMAWCHHRITEGEEDSVWVKYYVLKQKVHSN